MKGRGRAKVILLGEHAVVHGQPALAASLALGVEATVDKAAAWRVVCPEWELVAETPDAAPVRALARIASDLGATQPLAVRVRATVPARAGLGSSAALSVAFARAVAESAPDERIEAAASAGERVFHGNPSGVDVALAVRGGVGLFRRDRGLEPICVPAFPLAIGLSGAGRDTAAQVATVGRKLERGPQTTRAKLQALGELAIRGRELLLRGDPEALGPLLDRAHGILSELDVSTDRLDRLVALARQAGARGAKLTGAGGGGAVIALGDVEAVAAAWRAAGFQALTTEAGA